MIGPLLFLRDTVLGRDSAETTLSEWCLIRAGCPLAHGRKLHHRSSAPVLVPPQAQGLKLQALYRYVGPSRTHRSSPISFFGARNIWFETNFSGHRNLSRNRFQLSPRQRQGNEDAGKKSGLVDPSDRYLNGKPGTSAVHSLGDLLTRASALHLADRVSEPLSEFRDGDLTCWSPVTHGRRCSA